MKTRAIVKRKILIVFLIMTMIIIPQTGCKSNAENANIGISKTGFYLDTICTITIFGMSKDSEIASLDGDERKIKVFQLITDAFKICSDYEKQLSKTIKTSQVAQINAANGERVQVSDTTLSVIKKGIEYGDDSNGAFDITIGKVTDLWNFHDADDSINVDEEQVPTGTIPDEKELAEAVTHVDYKKIEIDGNYVRLRDPEMEIDLGGIAKGYIADRVADFLESKEVTSAVVDLGGNIVTVGGKSRDFTENKQDDFSIGIKDPLSESGRLLGVISCKDTTVVTSGTYERYFEVKGKKYHHILDVKTGYPTDTDVVSVTIIAPKGHSVDCDGLSTSCLALGVKKGTELISSIENVDAIFVDKNGKMTMTDKNIKFE